MTRLILALWTLCFLAGFALPCAAADHGTDKNDTALSRTSGVLVPTKDGVPIGGGFTAKADNVGHDFNVTGGSIIFDTKPQTITTAVATLHADGTHAEVCGKLTTGREFWTLYDQIMVATEAHQAKSFCDWYGRR